MSSLRPLITITLLAVVGVVLYMKINDTEPVLPSELDSQEWSTELEMGGDPTGLAAAAPNADAPVASEAQAVASEAPKFAPAASTTVASATADASGSQAPAWTPGALPVAETKPAIDAKKPGDASANATATTPAMPEIPAAAGDAAKTSTIKSAPSATAPKFDASAAAGAAAVGATAAGAAVAAAEQDESPVTPTNPFVASAPPSTSSSPGSMFAAARTAVQGALDRGELAQALLLLSDWYGDPSLTPVEREEVDSLLSQLAGSVIYEGPPAHRLEPAYLVQAGETLDDVARKYDVPAALLAKINGIASPAALQPGQELKVLRGPFSALIDLSERRMTLMLDRRYAGKFDIDLDPAATVEEGQWKVDQKLLTPAVASLYGQTPGEAAVDRSIVLANPANPEAQAGVEIRGPSAADPVAGQSRSRVIRLQSTDINDVFDILSQGSRVTIRR